MTLHSATIPVVLRPPLIEEVCARMAGGLGRPNASAVIRDALSAFGDRPHPPIPPRRPVYEPCFEAVWHAEPGPRPGSALVTAALRWYLGLPVSQRPRDVAVTVLPHGPRRPRPRR